MNFHWQNLNDKPGGRQGSGIRYGRAWFRLANYGISWEWSLFGTSCRAEFSVTQDEEIGFHYSLAIPLIGSFFLTIYGGLIAKMARWILARSGAGYSDRTLSVRIFSAAIWWTVWRDGDSWSSDTPKWREGCFHFDDFFLGKAKYSQRILSEHAVKIALPEASYDATVKLEEATWKRPRWFAVRRLGSHVDIPKGIPFPGKGENSWDCGEDATYGLSCSESTVEGAVAAVVRSVLKSRRRYGGSVSWAPEQQGAAE